MMRLERLRLAAAAAHRIPGISLTIWPVDGPSVVVSRLVEHQPDLSPCTLRELVVAVLGGEPVPVGLRWMFDPADLMVDGASVRHLGDGVVHLDGVDADERGRWWPTLIDGGSVAAVLADSAVDVIEEGLVEPHLVAAADISAHVDSALGVTVLHLRTPTGSEDDERRCDQMARAMARSCAIAELLVGAGSDSTAGGR